MSWGLYGYVGGYRGCKYRKVEKEMETTMQGLRFGAEGLGPCRLIEAASLVEVFGVLVATPGRLPKPFPAVPSSALEFASKTSNFSKLGPEGALGMD